MNYSNFRSPNFKEVLKSTKRFLPLVILIIFGVGALGILVWGFRNVVNGKNNTITSGSDPRVVISEARANTDINRNFEFPILDSKGKEVTKLKFNLLNAELRDEIIVKGKRVTSVKGRTFLIISLKITNDYQSPLEIRVSDYFRLTLNGNELEQLAPEVHSDPVAVQPISTKMTRVGFPINDTDENLTLWVGEVKGQKERIDLSL